MCIIPAGGGAGKCGSGSVVALSDCNIKGFIETSLLDWPGRVAAVVFLPGCGFGCPFCHNRGLVLNPAGIEDVPVEAVLASTRENAGWLDGVVVTGGEPTINPGLTGLLRLFRAEGLGIKLDTNGSMPDVLAGLIDGGLVDAFAMDIKAPLTREAYTRAAGVDVDVSRIRESIALLNSSGLEVTYRATVVPGLHDEDAVRGMASALEGRRLLLQDFRPDGALDPAYRKLRPLGPEEIARLQAIADEASG